MTYDMERVLADIDADHGDCGAEFVRHGVLLVLSVPCQFLMPAGLEHGRTIPLAVITGPLDASFPLDDECTLVAELEARSSRRSQVVKDRSVKDLLGRVGADSYRARP